MSKKYDLADYKFAKAVTRDFPKAIELLETLTWDMAPYAGYISIQSLLDDVYNTIMQLELNLKRSTITVNKKGSKDVE
jgi:hypothetical protein